MITTPQTGRHLAATDVLPRAFLLALLLTAVTPFAAHARTYAVLHHFDGGPGGKNVWSGLTVSGTTLFGTTEKGGTYGYGTVFRMELDGTGFSVVRSLNYADGAFPMGDLLVSGDWIYGTTSWGGSTNEAGTLFRLRLDGSEFAVLKYFGGFDGNQPRGGVALSGDTLFGTTYAGGTNQPYAQGTVYRINTDGTGFRLLHSYGSADGNCPCGTLVISGTVLYGTTSDWSIGLGTVFRVNMDGSGYTILKTFTGADGRMPIGNLLRSGNTLYGTTIHGGASDWGTVFRLNTDGTGFASLRNFPALGMPYGGLVISGQTLIGSTCGGGPANEGTLYRINMDGSDYTVITNLSGSIGTGPVAAMVAGGDGFYGTCRYGGANNAGVMFKLTASPPTITQEPRSCTLEIGSALVLNVHVDSCAPPSYRWLFNGTQAIGGGTSDPVYRIASVQTSNTGVYTVVVTNYFGAVTSTPAVVNVIPVVERRPVPFLTLTADPGTTLQLECAEGGCSGTKWTSMDTLTLATGAAEYFDLSSPLPAARYYRAWHATPGAPPPALDLDYVPAITLSGQPGNKLRLDFINAIGPVDAWSSLATLTLTNSTQLYFDTTVLGQPSRLYRIVPVP